MLKAKVAASRTFHTRATLSYKAGAKTKEPPENKVGKEWFIVY